MMTDIKTSRTRVTWIKTKNKNDICAHRAKLSKIVPFLFSDNSAVVPPEPIPNSEVKRSCADGSVGVPMWE